MLSYAFLAESLEMTWTQRLSHHSADQISAGFLKTLKTNTQKTSFIWFIWFMWVKQCHVYHPLGNGLFKKNIYKNADDWGMVNMALGITHTTEDPIPTSLYSQTFFRASGPTCSCSLAATWNDLLRVSEADTDCLNVEGKDSARLVAHRKIKSSNKITSGITCQNILVLIKSPFWFWYTKIMHPKEPAPCLYTPYGHPPSGLQARMLGVLLGVDP